MTSRLINDAIKISGASSLYQALTKKIQLYFEKICMDNDGRSRFGKKEIIHNLGFFYDISIVRFFVSSIAELKQYERCNFCLS